MKTDLGEVLSLADAYENRTGKKPELVQVPYEWFLKIVPPMVRHFRDDQGAYLFGMRVQYGDRFGVGRRETTGGTTLEYWQWLN